MLDDALQGTRGMSAAANATGARNDGSVSDEGLQRNSDEFFDIEDHAEGLQQPAGAMPSRGRSISGPEHDRAEVPGCGSTHLHTDALHEQVAADVVSTVVGLGVVDQGHADDVALASRISPVSSVNELDVLVLEPVGGDDFNTTDQNSILQQFEEASIADSYDIEFWRERSGEAQSDEAVAIVITAVLGAKDLYEAIGAAYDATQEELSRCYVQVAVSLHPHRRPSTVDLEEGFCLASAAWSELCDENVRRRYDAELSAHLGQNTQGVANSMHFLRPMTIEQAYLTFAAATAMCAESAPPEDFVETLDMAQMLVGAEQDAADNSVATSGICRYAVLAKQLAVSLAANMLGGSTSNSSRGQATQHDGAAANASGILGASPGPRVHDASGIGDANPGRRTGLRDAAVSERAELFGHSSACAHWLTGLGSCAHGRSKHSADAQIPTSGAQSSQDARTEIVRRSQFAPIVVGSRVCLTGLRTMRELNGRIGEVVGFNGTRYQIRLLGHLFGNTDRSAEAEIKLLKRENLELMSTRKPVMTHSAAEFI